jgi:GT2 family glycosyltransferase
MATVDTVTLGVPVYRGELFIEEALRSVLDQTHQDFEVIISLDGPQPAAEALCRPFLDDSRFRLVTQPERLGWVGNINWLMSQVTTPYWSFHQQDDILDPRCLEVLVDHARRTPEGSVFFGDIEGFGLLAETFSQASVTGDACTRQLAILHEHFNAVAFRGLTRVEALRHAGGLRANEFDSFACDAAWMGAMALSGELRRVPIVLSRKRFHDASEHRKWFAWPVEKRSQAWIAHCAIMLEQAMLVETTPQNRRLLWLAAVGRLAASRTALSYLPIASWTAVERVAFLDAFVEYVRAAGRVNIPALLDDGWDEIVAWTYGFYWLPGGIEPLAPSAEVDVAVDLVP